MVYLQTVASAPVALLWLSLLMPTNLLDLNYQN